MKIDQLIKEFCSNCVRYVPFPTVCEYIRGVTYNKKQEAGKNDNNTWKILRANNITIGKNTLNFEDVKEIVREVKIKETQFLKKNDILICAGSGSKEHVGKVAYIFDDLDYSFGGFMAVIRCNQELNSRFLFHYISSDSFKKYLDFALNSTTINNLSLSVMSNFQIPIPPLQVQEEIVRILDSFTSLTAELQARKNQYKFYLNSFFESIECEKVTLSSLGTLKRGKRFVHADDMDSGVPCIHYGELYTYYGVYADTVKTHIREELREKMRYATTEDVVIVGAGENNIDIGVGVAWLGNYDVAIHDACYTLHHKQNPKFISYFLRTDMYHNQIKKYVYEGKICSISAENVGKALIPLPSIEEQDRIVSILDRFDKLCNNMSLGLPAEIDARQKQYEYYRDKILSFDFS